MALTPKQQRFVSEYLIDCNATGAAVRAGYKHPNKQGPRLLVNVGVAAAIAEGQGTVAESNELTAEWVLGRLKIESVYDGEDASQSARVQALALLGKHFGLFPNKIEVESRGTLHIKKVIVRAAEHRPGPGSNGQPAPRAGGVLPG